MLDKSTLNSFDLQSVGCWMDGRSFFHMEKCTDAINRVSPLHFFIKVSLQ